MNTIVRIRTVKRSLVLLVTLVAVSLVSSPFIAYDSSRPATVGNSVKGCSWVIWQDAGTYQAIDKTGRNVYHVNNFSTTFHDVLSAINGGGGEICISDGTYPVEGSLGSGLPALDWNNLALTGNGVSTVLQLSPGMARRMINLFPVHNLTISGITFDGNGVQQKDTASRLDSELLFIGGSAPTDRANHVTVQDIGCKNVRYGTCVDGYGVDVKFLNSEFLWSGSPGAAFPSDHIHYGGRGIVVSGNFFNNSTDSAFACDSCSDVVVSNNIVWNAGTQAFALGVMGDEDSNLVYTGNLVNDTVPGRFFSATAGTFTNVAITGNTFINTSPEPTTGLHGIVIGDNARGVTISGNSIRVSSDNPNNFAIYLGNENTDVTVTGNEITSGGTSSAGCIDLDGATRFSIIGNNCHNSYYGLVLGGHPSNTGIIADNIFTNQTVTIAYFQPPTGNVEVVDNAGYNPINEVANFVAGSTFAPWGTSSTVDRSTDYVVEGSGLYFTSTGGTSVIITIKDGAGNTLYSPGATLTTPFYVPYRDMINFGDFTTAPTVTVWFT